MDAVVLSKSARSVVHAVGQPPAYNSTGHPAMAKGGMGDVLTGFCTAFAAQGMTLDRAAALGSWLLGFAAEMWRRRHRGAVESFTPSHLLEMSGPALASLRRGGVF
jgi:NAD(P)H-hydrate epimerase